MLKTFFRWLLYGRMGWTRQVSVALPEKCIICLAPHTSNWDFFIGQAYLLAEGFKANFLMKKEWFFWPLGALFRKMGGIPVCRSKHTRMTDRLAETARQAVHFRLCITPEGTRSLNPDWKKGFYYIALGAGIPILLYGVDYARKRIVCTKAVEPDGDEEGQMREIKLYYKDFKGKHPEKFTIGDVDEKREEPRH